MVYKQKECKALGEEGCYFLCLLWIAERELDRELDALKAFGMAKRKGWAGEDCYMAQPARMMTELLGKPCSIRKSWDFGEEIAANEWDIWLYKRKTAGATYWHFAVVSEGQVLYDPLGESNTVKFGAPESRRILTIS